MSFPILSFWTRADSDVKADRLRLAANRLRVNAESFVLEAREDVLTAEAGLQTAMSRAVNHPDFDRIVEARLAVVRAQRVLDEAVAVYEETFGTRPEISTGASESSES